MFANVQRYILLFCLIVFWGCKTKTEQTQAVIVDITESVYAPGVIKSENQYQVHSTVSGLLQKILVQEGDVVKKGDPLFVISNETSRLNAENARLAADFAELSSQQNRTNELKANVALAQQKMQSDSVLMLRQRGLWAQQIGSKVELELKELAFSSSKTAYETAVFRYNDLLKQLRFSSAQSQKNLSITKALQQDYTIRSQSDGRVYDIPLNQGDIVTPQTTLAIVGDADRFLIELQVDENDIVSIRTGQKIILSMDSYKGQTFEAKVDKISPIMNQQSRTFLIDARFTRQPEILFPNLSLEANIIIRTKAKALTIPRSYLLKDSFVLMSNQENRKVETGLKDYERIEIISGLTADDVILKPQK